MSRGNPITFLALLALPLLSIAGLGKEPSKPTSETLSAITARGILLAGYDNAAWHASDAVQAIASKADPLSRYIAIKNDRGWVVDFGNIDEGDNRFLVRYEAVQADSTEQFKVTTFEKPREDAGWNLAAARGIGAALKDFRGVDRPYNVAVIPADSGEIFVYVYLAQVTTEKYIYGADVRYRFSADGRTILEKRQLHKSVIDIAPSDPSVKQEAGYHTHVLTDLPEDTDVLLVLQRMPKIPEYVGAGGWVYTIDITGKIAIAGKLK